MCQAKVGLVEGEVLGDATTNYRIRMLGPWMVLFGGSHFDTSLDLRALQANLGVKLAWHNDSRLWLNDEVTYPNSPPWNTEANYEDCD